MKSCKVAVLVSGSGTNLQAIIDATEDGTLNGKVQVVISDREGVYALERAEKYHIDSFYIRKDSRKLLQVLAAYEVDFIVLAGYLSILDEDLIREYEGKIINIHPSLIPKYCGKGYYGIKVHEGVIAAKERETGVTVHYVDQGIDTGKIIRQERVPVMENDSAESLQKRVLKMEHKVLIEVLKGLMEEGCYESDH